MSTLIDARRRRVARGCTVVLRVPPSLESRESIWTDPVTRCARVMNHPESGDQARPLPGSNDALSTWENRETASELSWRIDMAGASARDKRARTSTSRQVGDPGPAASACTCALPDSPGVLVPAEPVVAAAAPLGPARPRTRARAPALSLSRSPGQCRAVLLLAKVQEDGRLSGRPIPRGRAAPGRARPVSRGLDR